MKIFPIHACQRKKIHFFNLHNKEPVFAGVLEQCGNLAASDYQNMEPLCYLNQLTVGLLIFVHIVTAALHLYIGSYYSYMYISCQWLSGFHKMQCMDVGGRGTVRFLTTPPFKPESSMENTNELMIV